jgi:excisionase family DNA binding protein
MKQDELTNIQHLLKLDTDEIYQYLISANHKERIELSSKVNSLKGMIDTIMKHDIMAEPVLPYRKPENLTEPALTVKEASKELKFSTVTIYDMIHSGIINAFKVGKKYRISRDEINRLKKVK